MSIAVKSANQHLAWKEHRLLRPMVIGSAAATLISLAVIYLTGVETHVKQVANACVSLACIMSCLVGLYLGILPFAPERELGTDQLIASMPIQDRQVGRSKLSLASIYFFTFLIAAFAAVSVSFLLVKSLWIWSELNTSNDYAGLLVWVLFPIEVYLWSVFASQRFQKTIHASLAAAGLSFAGLIVSSYLSDWIGIKSHAGNSIYTVLPIHVAIIMALAVVVIRQSNQWLRLPTGSVEGLEAKANITAAVSFRDNRQKLDSAYPWKSLLWQQWRSIRMGLIVPVVLTIGFLLLVGSTSFFLPDRMGFDRASTSTLQMALLYTTILGAWMGLSAFAGDQTGCGYLFFQQQAVDARRLWASRILPILILVPILAGILVAIFFWFVQLNAQILQSEQISYSVTQNWWHLGSLSADWQNILNAVMVFVGVAGVGQLISMLFRSGFLMVLAGIIGCATAGWWFSYLAWLGAWLWLVGWPLALMPFLFTYWYRDGFVRGGREWRAIALAILVTTVSLAASTGGLAYLRLSEFEPVEGPEPLDAFFEDPDREIAAAPEKFSGLDELLIATSNLQNIAELMRENQVLNAEGKPYLYSDIAEMQPIDYPAEVTSMLAAQNRDAVERIESALKQNGIEYGKVFGPVVVAFDVAIVDALNSADQNRALQLMLTQIRGNKSGYLRNPRIEHWVAWIRLAGQNESSLRNGLNELDNVLDEVFDIDNNFVFKNTYLEYREFTGDRQFLTSAVNLQSSKGNDRMHAGYDQWAWPVFPWELERGRRAYSKNLVQHPFEAWEHFCETLDRPNAIGWHYLDWSDYRYKQGETTGRMPVNYENQFGFQNKMRQLVSLSGAVRYIKVRLGLAIYHAQHNEYPEKLTDLSDNVLDVVPVDPLTGMDFSYAPNGLSEPAISVEVGTQGYASATSQLQESNWAIPADQPFVLPWSGIVDIERCQFVISNGDRYEMNTETQQQLKDSRKFGILIPKPRMFGYRLEPQVSDTALLFQLEQ